MAERLLPAALAEVVGAAAVVTDPELVVGATTDWTGRFRGTTPAVVRPASAEEVAGVLEVCRRHGAALVPQGGNTGLVGGSVPLAGEVVLSLVRLRGVEAVDAAARRAVVLAGTPLSDLQRAAAAAGLAYGVDLAARETATVGGSVATNAAGIRFVRYGATRAQLAGVEAVLGNGLRISHLGALDKDNTGYDLAGLLCGSEGTLGVVTRAALRLVERYEERAVALLGFDSPEQALASVAELRAAGVPLEAVEILWPEALHLVCEAFALPLPLPGGPAGAYLLVEAAAHEDPLPALAAAVEQLAGLVDVAVATDERRRRELWRLREDVAAALATAGTPVKMDVSVPLPAQPELASRVGELLGRLSPGALLVLFGHAADGNLHVNVVPAAARRSAAGAGRLREDEARAIEGAVYRLAAELGGSISAEHGIGTSKLEWLPLVRSPAELASFRAVKAALDPDGICNPACLVPPAAGAPRG